MNSATGGICHLPAYGLIDRAIDLALQVILQRFLPFAQQSNAAVSVECPAEHGVVADIAGFKGSAG